MDASQRGDEESAQGLSCGPILGALRFHWRSAVALAAIFAVQFFVTETTGRYILSAIQVLIAVGMLIAHRAHILPTLAAPFRRTPARERLREAPTAARQ
ncbi:MULTISPECIES: hypothetical protein [unclassified Microbacterium]|uniref:hypothetical protein n=1 Tax=unclassified Microbacterium TaxID=2609290 RepID=UPI001656FA7A|nr:hypothetical protein [Microbacterium sp. Nx66]